VVHPVKKGESRNDPDADTDTEEKQALERVGITHKHKTGYD